MRHFQSPTLYVTMTKEYDETQDCFVTRVDYVPKHFQPSDLHDGLLDLINAGVSPNEMPLLHLDPFTAINAVQCSINSFPLQPQNS